MTGVRFYKAVDEHGHACGDPVVHGRNGPGVGTFTNETASGWQTVLFASPVAVTAGTTYIVGYYAPNGHYSYTSAGFASAGVTNGPLTAVSNGTSPNGVYSYATQSTFPASTFNSTNYWVDVEFQPGSGGGGSGPPSAPTGVIATPASGEAGVTWTAPSNVGGGPVTGYTVTPYAGSTAGTPVSVGANATGATVSGLTDGTAYTFKVTATNSSGTGPASSASAAVTPEATIFDLAAPSVADGGDSSSVEVGVKFTASASGTITGVRFYKAATNGGTHIGSLWTANGTLLASGTFTNETSSGWQTLTFASPVAVTPGATYVAGYLAPVGHYTFTTSGFATAVTNGPLTAVGNGTSPNGVYAYTGTSAFPSSSFNAANYWVDVMFQAGGSSVPTPPMWCLRSRRPVRPRSAGQRPPARDSALTGYTVTPYAGTTAGTPVTVGPR